MTAIAAILTIILGTTLPALAVVLVGFLSKEWVGTRIRESIAAEYARQTETVKDAIAWEAKRRAEAGKVAEVLRLWVKAGRDDAVKPELAKAYAELALWLDAKALRALNDCMTYTNDGSFKSALIAARKVLVGPKDDVRPEELIHWEF